MELIQLITQFNLTRQEATIYLALLSEGDLNGYETAKITGTSRSNTYIALSLLVEKGAAYVMEGSTVRYSPVPLEEFCDNVIRRLEKTKAQIIRLAPEKRKEADGYITVKGETHILNKVRTMLSGASERVYLSASDQILESLLPDIREVMTRGIKVVLITNPPLELEGATVYFMRRENHQIGLIVDSFNVLTGDIEDTENSTCLYSQKKNLVDLFKDSMKNDIKLIELMKGNQEL